MRPRIKICCIKSVIEAHLAVKMGADALGLVGEMPSGPGPIPDELIGKIVSRIPPPIGTFLLTSETDAQAIIRHQKRVGSNTIQIVDNLKTGTYTEIKAAIPTVKLVQVIHVRNEASIEEAIQVSKFVDAILLDSGKPDKRILGGTGETHDWNLSARLVDLVPVPVFLAGGINAGNLEEAYKLVKPYGIDLCSSVRTNDDLDPVKLRSFFEAVNQL